MSAIWMISYFTKRCARHGVLAYRQVRPYQITLLLSKRSLKPWNIFWSMLNTGMNVVSWNYSSLWKFAMSRIYFTFLLKLNSKNISFKIQCFLLNHYTHLQSHTIVNYVRKRLMKFSWSAIVVKLIEKLFSKYIYSKYFIYSTFV